MYIQRTRVRGRKEGNSLERQTSTVLIKHGKSQQEVPAFGCVYGCSLSPHVCRQILDRQMWLSCMPSELLSEHCCFVYQLCTTTTFPSLWNVPVMTERLRDEGVLGSEFADLAEHLDRDNNHGLSCSRAAQAFVGGLETDFPKAIRPSLLLIQCFSLFSTCSRQPGPQRPLQRAIDHSIW